MKLYTVFLLSISLFLACNNKSVDKISVENIATIDSLSAEDSFKIQFKKILCQLNLKEEESFYKESLHQVLPQNRDLTIWVIPIEKEQAYESTHIYAYVLLTDTESSKIISSNYHFYERSKDPYRYYMIHIDTLNYTLNSDRVIFAVNTFFKGSSSVSIYDEGFTQIYMQEGDSLLPLFDYLNTLGQGEISDNVDADWFTQYKTQLFATESKNNGFSDFILRTKEQVNPESVTFRDYQSIDSIRIYHYIPSKGYVETDKTQGIIVEELNEGGIGEHTYYYFNKTLDEVYLLLYQETSDYLQKYMLPEPPNESISYTLPSDGEPSDSLIVTYTIKKRKELAMSFDTEISGLHYFLREHDTYTKVIYSYHD